ncbi:hypothetical protein [Lentilactobacillus otakiensis]
MMASMRIHVSPKVIEWVVQNSDFNGLSEEWQLEVARWLDYGDQPTMIQIKELSRLLYVPFGYFFLDLPPVEDCALFELRTVVRRINKKPSRNLIETVQDMALRQSEVRDKRAELDYPVCRFVGAGVANLESADDAALKVFKLLGIDDDWYGVKDCHQRFDILQEKLANMDVLVAMRSSVVANADRKLDLKEFRGFVLLDEYLPVIFINGNDSWKKRLFVLVHETVHVWLGTAELFDGSDRLDQKFRNPGGEQRAYAITKAMLAK